MILEDVIVFLKKNPPFQSLDESTLRGIASSLSMQFYPKDTVILKQDGPPSDSVRIIKKGGVKVLMKSETGENIVIDYRGEGDNFGFLSLIGKDRQKTTVIAIDDTICYVLNREKVLKLIETNPSIAEYYMSYLSRYVDRTYREMHNKSLFYGGTDRLLFTTSVGEIAKDAVTVGEETSIQDAALIMAKNKITSLIILDKRKLPVGIVTDRDLREKVVAKGRNISEPVKNIMTISLIRAEAGDSCFSAVLKMIKYNIHHILVIKDGELQGIMTNHDLMLLQGSSPLSFVHNVDNQQTLDGLAALGGRITNLVGLLLREGATANNIASIITEINDRIMRKILEITERQYGRPPIPYCWIVFGCEGRREQVFKTDQDNAIIYADPSPEEEQEVERYFEGMTALVRDSLVRMGYPLNPAGYMASSAEWRRPLKSWKKRFSEWISCSDPEEVLRSLIFFDFRPVYGKFGLAEDLRDSFIHGLGDKAFLGALAEIIVRNTPPVGFLKSFVVEKSGEHKDKFDMRAKGAAPLVNAVRLFALEKGVKETSTLGRIQALKQKHPVIKEYGDELEHAFEFIMMLRIHHQFNQISSGVEPDNFINPNNLSNLEKKTLREAFHLTSKIQSLIGGNYKPVGR